MKPRILDMTLQELHQVVAAMGEKPYRADQLADWVYRKGVTDPAKMTNLPAEFTSRFDVLTSKVVTQTVSQDGTIKLLVAFTEGGSIETVLIPSPSRGTACLSTQVGCAMACRFCASGATGLERNLTAGEILQQILHLQHASGLKVTNVVFMGMGEPLANYEATVSAVRSIVDPQRFGLSARKVTVSTAGLPKQIRRLGQEGLPITLAISIQAPNDPLRRQLMPKAARAPLEDILSAAEAFYGARKREVTLEYVLIDGVNDNDVCAEGLARIARRLRCNVNLIRYNPVEQVEFERPSQAKVRLFAARLTKRGVNVHVRRSRGLDATAACGQLRRLAEAK